jgi:hypothetical protein
MKWLTVLIGGVAIPLAFLSSPASATLLGWCGTGATSTCIDNGTNSPVSTNPPGELGFTSSPGGETGSLFLKILVPDTATVPGNTIPLSGGFPDATLVTGTTPGPWTSGSLQDYLGGAFVGVTPDNPIGAYLPSTQALVPGATGFDVFESDLGTQTLAGASGPPNQFFDVPGGVPQGSYFVAFIGPGIEATANSGAIFVTAPCTGPSCSTFPPLPEPSALAVLGTGLALLGMGFLWRRKSG